MKFLDDYSGYQLITNFIFSVQFYVEIILLDHIGKIYQRKVTFVSIDTTAKLLH